jgi:type VII secretion integral membrane protein EccD
MCRLVVCAPDRQVELAVPAQVVVADLLPALLHRLGGDLADAGMGHDGWVLQQLGSAPLDEDSTIAALGLCDGDIVHLRPRTGQIPQADFDDLLDGVATAVRSRPGRWRPELTGWAASGLLAVVLLATLAGLALPGAAMDRSLSAAAFAAASLVAAFAVTRAGGDRVSGMVFALCAIAAAALAGMILPDVHDTSAPLLAAPELLAGSAIAGSVAIVAALVTGVGGPLFAALISGSVFAAGGAGLAVFAHLPASQAAAVVAVAATVVGPVLPLLAFRLAGLRLNPLPTEPEHLQQDLGPEPSEQVLRGGALADAYLTGLYCGLGLAAAVALAIFATQTGWAVTALIVAVALARLLQTRLMVGAWHRLATGAPAVVVTAVLLVAWADRMPVGDRLELFGPVLVLAVPVLLVVARSAPVRRPTPIWGQLGDTTQMLATIAMFPLLFEVVGLFGYMRALWG